MARDNSIAISDEELQQLKDARLEIFSTDEVPYGATISRLCENLENND
jgi:predicted short-subunit dehydrogenase-like oxidoreductase (DUF2520 family)